MKNAPLKSAGAKDPVYRVGPLVVHCTNRVSSPQDLYTMNLHTTSWIEREMEKKSFSRPTHDHNFLTRHKQNKVSMCFRVGTIVEFHAVFFFVSQIIFIFAVFLPTILSLLFF